MQCSTAIDNVRDFCLSILGRGDLEAKLRHPRLENGDWLPDDDPGPPLMVESPARDPELAMGSGSERLPRLNELRNPDARIQCLERFANHELMAVELFAWALLAFPDLPRVLRRGFLRVLEEEQIHLGLYLDRLGEIRLQRRRARIDNDSSDSTSLGRHPSDRVPLDSHTSDRASLGSHPSDRVSLDNHPWDRASLDNHPADRASMISHPSDRGPFAHLPLGDYFWQQVPALSTSLHGPRAFLAAMGLTFEQANLDYSLLYRDAFRNAGDEETARVIERVHRDEVGHVRMAAVWLRRLGGSGRSDVDLYREAIPFPLSAARAKARRFDAESRRRAGLSEEMIEFVRHATPYDRQTRGVCDPALADRRIRIESGSAHRSGVDTPTAHRSDVDPTPAQRSASDTTSDWIELFANVGAEEEAANSDEHSSQTDEFPSQPVEAPRHSESPFGGKPSSTSTGPGYGSGILPTDGRASKIVQLGALWQLTLRCSGASRVVVPQRGRRRAGTGRLHPAAELHPAFREWLSAQRDPSPILHLLQPDRHTPAREHRDSETAGSTDQRRGALIPWLSTGEALERALRQGLQYLAPEPRVVRRVHDKSFAVRQGNSHWNESMSGCVAVLDPAEICDAARGTERVESLVATWPDDLRKSFTLKPRFGTSGRGRVRGVDGKLPLSSIRALPRLADRGGVVLEPWFDRMRDFSVQLFIRSPDQIELLGSTEQIVARSGLYLGNRGILRLETRARDDRRIEHVDLPSGLHADRGIEETALTSGHRVDSQLRDAALAIARAAAAEGFFGPCGVDSFSYRSLDGSEQLRPVVEFNARMTTGIIALAAVRAALEIAGELKAARWEFRLEGDRGMDEPSAESTDSPAPQWLITLPLLVDADSGPTVRLG